MNNQKLKNKVALVTGGTSGIGLATAQLFQDEGARVVVTGRSDASLAAARDVLGPSSLVVKSDISVLQDVEALAETMRAQFEKVDIVFANAGIANFVELSRIDEAYFDSIINTNVKGVVFTVQKMVPIMSPGGSIILTGSSLDVKGRPGSSIYGASKAAVRSLARGFASELVERGIRVNVLSPGPVATPIFGRMGFSKAKLDSMMENYPKSVPMQRMGVPEEIAKVALFLASDDSFFKRLNKVQASVQ